MQKLHQQISQFTYTSKWLPEKLEFYTWYTGKTVFDKKSEENKSQQQKRFDKRSFSQVSGDFDDKYNT